MLSNKLPYAIQEDDLMGYYNFMAKSLNGSLNGEKYRLITSMNQFQDSMNKMAASLNSRKILNMNLQYVNEGDNLLDKYNWAVKVINSSKG